jgi:hypothetical protein
LAEFQIAQRPAQRGTGWTTGTPPAVAIGTELGGLTSVTAYAYPLDGSERLMLHANLDMHEVERVKCGDRIEPILIGDFYIPRPMQIRRLEARLARSENYVLAATDFEPPLRVAVGNKIRFDIRGHRVSV